MRAITIVLGSALLLGACGGAAAPAATPSAPAPSATSSAPAGTVTFTANMLPSNEVPPITDAEKSGSAKATVTFDITRNSSATITAATASISATLSGFPAGTEITLCHIHQAAPGANGPVKVPFKTDAANPLVLTDGSGTFSKSGVTVDPALMQQILDAPGGFYVNFHTKLHAAGVARGQLTKM